MVNLKKQWKISELAKLVVAMRDMMKGISKSAHKHSTQPLQDKKALSKVVHTKGVDLKALFKVVHTKSSSVVLLTHQCTTLKENMEGWKLKHDLLKDELASLYWVPCEMSADMICLQEEVKEW